MKKNANNSTIAAPPPHVRPAEKEPFLLSSKQAGKIDYILLASILSLVVIGLVFVYSASFYTAEKYYNNKFFYLIKQATGAAVGAVAFFAALYINPAILKKAAYPLLALSAVFLAVVLIPGVGVEKYGARRWIGLGAFTFQPSEIAKFAFVIFAAVYMSSEKVNMTKFKSSLPVLGVGFAFCALIIIEPNMSITICMALIMLSMLFMGGTKLKIFLLMLAPLAAAVVLLILLEPYRVQRLLAFINPWATPKDEGYQLIQSLYGLGSGGFFGLGLFNSRQKYQFLPFAESDFIFSIIGEETGFLGATIVMLLFAVIIWRGISSALRAKDKYNAYLAGGITAVIAIQSILNIAVVTGCIPPTGLPLPFISYGGTSLVVFMAAGGVLVNLARR